MSVTGPALVALAFALLDVIVVALSVRTAPQGYTFVVERLGRHHETPARRASTGAGTTPRLLNG